MTDSDYVNIEEIKRLAGKINNFLVEEGVEYEIEAEVILDLAKTSWRDETQMKKFLEGRHLEGDFDEEN